MQDLIGEEGWTVLDAPILEGPGASVSHEAPRGQKLRAGHSNAAFKRVGDFFMLRLSTVVRSVLADSSKLSVFPRPEILADPELIKSMGIEFAGFSYAVEEILSPGDIITTVSLSNSFFDEMSKAGAQVALLTGSRPPDSNLERTFRERRLDAPPRSAVSGKPGTVDLLFFWLVGVQVFNSIDGRPLVPYQAVVRRSQWLSASERFEAAWKIHKAHGISIREVTDAQQTLP
eukprot:Skav202054  [mRNA]  locus=scaffold1138:498020:505011:- [translate_table: standard]